MDFGKVKQIKIKEGIVTKIRHIATDTILWVAKVLALVTGKPPLMLEKSTGEELVDYKVYGESVQDTELYSPDLWADGFINSSGDADPVSSSSYPDAKYFKIALKRGQVVQFTVEPDNISNGRVRYIDPETNTVVGTISGSGNNNGYATSTAQESSGFVSGTITALKDVTLAFMVIRGTVGTYTTFSLTMGISPSNPIEIESVGDKTANIVDIQGMGIKSVTAKSGTAAGLTWEVLPNGGIKINGTCTSDTYTDLYFEGSSSTKTPKYPKALKAGTYAIKTLKDNYDGTIKGGIVNLYSICYDSDLTNMGSNTVTINSADKAFTLPRDAIYVRTFLRIPKDVVLTDFVCYPMIIEGNVVGNFEPYGYKIPVKLSGKNLFDKNSTPLDAYVSAGKVSGHISCKTYVVKVKPNTTYTLTYDNSEDLSQPRCYVTGFADEPVINSSGGKQYYTDSITKLHEVTFTTGADINYLTLWLVYSVNEKTPTILSTVQLEESSQATPYDPYFEPYTENIYLNEPLRKIDDYADYVDFENQKVVRNIGKRLIDVTGIPTSKLSGYSIGRNAGIIDSAFLDIPVTVMSDYFNYEQNTIQYAKANMMTRYQLTQQLLWCIPQSILGTTDASTETEIVTAINNWATANNILIYLPMATPTEESIDLPSVLTQKGTNTISIDTKIQPSNMEVKYYKG